MFDLPPAIVHNEVQPQCVQMVAGAYAHDPLILIGLLKAEAGRVGMKNQNKNKSYDYGIAQVNSAWLPDLAGSGIGEQELMYDACKNLWVAGWILKRCVNKHKGQIWTAVGCYHAGENARKPEQLQRLERYSLNVQKYLQQSGAVARQWLEGGYNRTAVQHSYTAYSSKPRKARGLSMTIVDNP